MKLIATLEDLFEQGVETLPELVSGLNAVRMHDQQGEPWSDASFQAFLQVNGYRGQRDDDDRTTLSG